MAATEELKAIAAPEDEPAVPGDETSAERVQPYDEGLAAAPFAAPLFILAPPRSYTSLVCAMLGQHPQMYGFPELHLFSAVTIEAWWQACAKASFSRKDGTLRAIAQLFYGGQTEENVQQARGWLRRRPNMSTGLLLELLAQRVYPRVPVEKSPSITYSAARMRRAHSNFPGARYLHLLRHPRTQAESMLRQLERKRARGARVPPYWLDPPLGWYANHRHICNFLDTIPSGHSIRVRAEDLLQNPDDVLTTIVRWLGLRDDGAAIEAMKHPERSPFARLGPSGATFGADRNFLESPEFRAGAVAPANLEDPLAWRADGGGLLPRVKKMARSFGYE